MSETETIKVIERPKPSKLQRIKSAATHVGVYAIPAAVVGGSMYFTWKIFDMPDNLLELDYDTILAPGNRPCIAIDFKQMPRTDFHPKYD